MELTFPLILDGATGTELQKRGFGGSASAEAWVLDHPEAILEIQRGYVNAGSRVLYTPTFGANRVKLEEHGIFNKVTEFNTRLASLSKEAADGRAWVAGDIAPTGLLLYPFGDVEFGELVAIYTEQAAALEQAGVDLFVVETMMTVAEARAAVLAVRSVSRKPLFVSFTCDVNGRTLGGSDVTACLQILQGMEIDAFGLNCSTGPAEMAAQLARLGEIARVPLIAKPNAGVPVIRGGKAVYSCPPEEFTAYLDAFAEAGVAVFGGCCGTTEDHIRLLAERTKGLKPKKPSPAFADRLPAATEKEAFFLDPAVPIPAPVPADADLEDRLEDALESDDAVVAVAIETEEGIGAFADCQYRITKPLCLYAENAALLEGALLLYQGRALYDGPLSAQELEPLVRRYGVIA